MTRRPVMRQSWRDLLFLHFPCDPAEVQARLPAGLEVDTFGGQAWVGLVPFAMRDVRLAFLPPLPGANAFPETNVRTYVRGPDGPGVWFFSLDATNRLAVWTARAVFALPYFHARMSVARDGDRVRYEGFRSEARYAVEAELGSALGASEPGSLQHFLVERYLLYAARGGRLSSGRVAHHPYGLRAVTARVVDETLVRAVGLTARPFVHAAFSEGVDVDVFALRKLR